MKCPTVAVGTKRTKKEGLNKEGVRRREKRRREKKKRGDLSFHPLYRLHFRKVLVLEPKGSLREGGCATSKKRVRMGGRGLKPRASKSGETCWGGLHILND